MSTREERIEYQKIYRQLNGAKLNAGRRRRYRKNLKIRKIIKDKARKQYWKNRDAVLKQKRSLPEDTKQKNREKAIRYYWRNAEKLRKKSKQNYAANREQFKIKMAKYRRERKETVLRTYGGECAYCRTKELAILSIDHINDDGFRDRKKSGLETNSYAALLKGLKRSDLQVLCLSCQWRKRAYGPDFSKWPEKMEFLSKE